MDSVRLGRSLGMGARGAAKVLAEAVDAATAPNPRAQAGPTPPQPPPARPQPGTVAPGPSPAQTNPSTAAQTGTQTALQTAARKAARAVVQAESTRRDVARGGKRFGEAVWRPLAKLSGVLWLEITGSFFGIFALFTGQAAWTRRADLSLATPNRSEPRLEAAVFLAITLLFSYFCVTSFLRAQRRQRGR